MLQMLWRRSTLRLGINQLLMCVCWKYTGSVPKAGEIQPVEFRLTTNSRCGSRFLDDSTRRKDLEMGAEVRP